MHCRVSVNIRSAMQFQCDERVWKHNYLRFCCYKALHNITFKTLNPKVQGSTPLTAHQRLLRRSTSVGRLFY